MNVAMPFGPPSGGSSALLGEYWIRSQRNQAYSQRAFARDLSLSHTFLSRLLSGKRQLSLKMAVAISDRLNWTGPTRAQFLSQVVATQSVGASKVLKAPFTLATLDRERFRLFSEWYGPAIWTLISTPGFRPDPKWVAGRLGIRSRLVEAIVKRMVRAQILEVTEGRWIKRQAYLQVPEFHGDSAIVRYHEQMLEKAKASLMTRRKPERARRDITGATFTADPKRLAEAKKRIARFRKSLMTFLSDGTGSEVYQLNVQLFPLTKQEGPR